MNPPSRAIARTNSFRLGLPLIINNVLIGLTTFIDFVMAGRIGALDGRAETLRATAGDLVAERTEGLDHPLGRDLSEPSCEVTLGPMSRASCSCSSLRRRR